MKKTITKSIATVDSQAISVTTAYDDSIASFQWVKAMLESSFPKKNFVFVHDQCFCLRDYGDMPRGYTHTFLIRNPYKLFPSWKKVFIGLMPSYKDIPFTEIPVVFRGQKYGYGEMINLIAYVQEQLDQSPIIIDADDLQANPASILKQYCHLTGVKFNESMLQWKAGDEIVDTWIASKNILQGNKLQEGGYYDDAFKSTEFHPPKRMPSRDQIDSDLLPIIDQCMPLYEKMYSMRIQP